MYAHMSDFGSGWFGYGLLHMAFFWVVLVALLIVLLRVFLGHRQGNHDRPRDAADILEQRFARGEIDKGEFEEKMSALGFRRHR